jgi:hypothetical protein
MNVLAFHCAALLLLSAGTARATTQIPDSIEIENEAFPLLVTPLKPVLNDERNRRLAQKLQRSPCSASWRGYRASWKVENSQLVLLSVLADPCGPSNPIKLSKLFGWGVKQPVIAEWFSGELVVPRGKMAWVEGAWDPQYEEYLLISVERGDVTGSKTVSGEMFRQRQGQEQP